MDCPTIVLENKEFPSSLVVLITISCTPIKSGTRCMCSLWRVGPHSLFTLHSTLCSFYTLHSTFYTLHWTVSTSTLYSFSTLHYKISTLNTLHSTFYTLHSALYTHVLQITLRIINILNTTHLVLTLIYWCALESV